MTDNINHPKHYTSHPPYRAKLWSERKPPSKKACLECGVPFQPYCGGDKYCHPCRPARARKTHATAMRNYRDKNRSHVRRVKANWDLKTKFKMTIEEYELMSTQQGGCCAICKENPKGRGRGVLRPLCVDHCHKTGRIRGLLCADCNTAIGLLREDAIILDSAKNYLNLHISGERDV